MTNFNANAIAKATKREVKKGFDILEAVHTSDAFQGLLKKLWTLQPGVERQVFIKDIVHSNEQLEYYGIANDSGVSLQRTYFDDDRPTLMALVYHLPENLGFRKVTITYDDITRYEGDGGDFITNPFTASIMPYRKATEEMAGSEHVIRTVLELPDDPDERLTVVRQLTPDSLPGTHIPELRVAARWFEHDMPMTDSSAIRYFQSPNKYIDGKPPSNPRPPVKPPPPYLSDQWFVKMKPLAVPALRVVHKDLVRFHPERWTKVYEHWMMNIRDWCISRQIWWGHRIPVYTGPDGRFTAARNEDEARQRLGLNPSEPVTQDENVLDTWFSSWLWPFSTLGWPKDSEDLRYFNPTETLVTVPTSSSSGWPGW